MALSADRLTDRKEGEIQLYLVKSATTIYKGALVMVDSTGYAVEATAGGGIFVGVAVEGCVNPSGGALAVRVHKKGNFKFVKTGTIVQANLGAALKLSDDETVALLAPSLTTALAGAVNNDLVWAGKGEFAGEKGEQITIEYRNPAAGLTAGALTTNLAGAVNNDLVWTAKAAYAGKPISITYLDPYVAYAAKGGAETITVDGYGITVHLATDAGTGAVTSTGDSIKITLAAHALANAMVTAVDAAGNDGSGVVAAMASTPLVGGAGDSTAGISATESIEVTGTAIVVNLATSASGVVTSTGDTIKATLALHTVAAAMVTAVDATGNDGTGLVAAMVPTPLSGGDYVGDLQALDGSSVWVRIDKAVA